MLLLRFGVLPKASGLHSWGAPPSNVLSTCLHFSGVKKSRRDGGELGCSKPGSEAPPFGVLGTVSTLPQGAQISNYWTFPTTWSLVPFLMTIFLVPKHIYNAHIHAHVPKSSGPSGGEEKPQAAPQAVSLSPPGSGSRLRERGSARGRQPSLPPPRSLGEGDPSAGGLSL